MNNEIGTRTELNGSAGEQVDIRVNLRLPSRYAEFLSRYAAMTGARIEDLVSDGTKAILEMHSSDLGRLPGNFKWRLENQ